MDFGELTMNNLGCPYCGDTRLHIRPGEHCINVLKNEIKKLELEIDELRHQLFFKNYKNLKIGKATK